MPAGPRDGANFATCGRKMIFFEGYPVGWGCVQGLGRGGPGAVGHGPRERSKFRNLRCILKMMFFEGCPVG